MVEDAIKDYFTFFERYFRIHQNYKKYILTYVYKNSNSTSHSIWPYCRLHEIWSREKLSWKWFSKCNGFFLTLNWLIKLKLRWKKIVGIILTYVRCNGLKIGHSVLYNTGRVTVRSWGLIQFSLLLCFDAIPSILQKKNGCHVFKVHWIKENTHF